MFSIKKHIYIIFLSLILNSTLFHSIAHAEETSPANRALSYLELSEDYSITDEEAVSDTESSITLNNDFQKTSNKAFVIKTGADKWMIVLNLGNLDAGPLAVEDMLLVYSKGGQIPKEKGDEFKDFIGEEFHEAALTTQPGINFYAALGANENNQAVEYMFDTLDITISGEQKIYGSMNTYDNVSDLRLSTPLASEGQMKFPAWLHLKPKESLDLEIDCQFQFSTLFSKHPTNPLLCAKVFVKTEAEFNYGDVDLDLELKIGLATSSEETDDSAKKEEQESFTDFKFVLDSKVKGANETDLVNIGGVGLKEVVLEFEQTFFSEKSGESSNLSNSLPHSVYTFGGKLELGETQVGLYGIFAPSIDNPSSAGLVASIDKVTLKDLAELAVGMASITGADPISDQLKDDIHQLPLDQIFISNVTIAYTPEASNAAGIKEDGFTFEGSLTILDHVAGSVDINVGKKGVRTKDSIQPFSVPGFVIIKANLNIFIPTSGEDQLKTAFLNNLNFILIDMDIKIVGLEEQIKFKIGVSGFSFIFHLNLSHDYEVKLIAEAPVSGLANVQKFRFEADLKTGDPDAFKNLIDDLTGNLASNNSLGEDIGKLSPDLTELQDAIDQAITDNQTAKNSYHSTKAEAQKELNKITNPIQKAQDFLNSKKSLYDDAHGHWNHWKGKRNGYHWYQFDEIASAEAKVIFYEGEKDAAKAVVNLAAKALEAINASIHFIPVDAYPEVIAKLALYRLKQYALSIAKGALAAAQAADEDLQNFADMIQNNLDFFAITGISVSGDINHGASLSATLKITGQSFHQDWDVSPTVTLAPPMSPDEFSHNIEDMVTSLFSPSKYAAMRTKASHTASSYAEYPANIVLDFAWQEHGGIQNLVPSGWKGRFSDVAVNDNHLYVLTTTSKVKRYSIDSKEWQHVGIGPASRDFKRIAVNENGDVAFVTKNNNLWVNRQYVSAGNGPRGTDVGLNSQALWFIGLDKKVYRFDLQTKTTINYGGVALAIDVSEDDIPWIIGGNNIIYHLTNDASTRTWQSFSTHKGLGIDIAIAKPGRPWVIGTDNALWSYHPEISTWHSYPGNFNAVSVAPKNLPAMLDDNGKLDFLLKLNNHAIDISYGGSGTTAGALITNSNFNLWKFSNGHWETLKNGVARVDGNSNGEIWVVSHNNQIFHRPSNSQTWSSVTGWASDISVGEDGTVVRIGRNSTIWKYTGNNSWQKLVGSAEKVSVSPNGIPWVVNSNGSIYKFSNNTWDLMTGLAEDISISNDDTVWILGTDENVWKYSNGNNKWTKINGTGKAIATDNNNLPWIVGEDFGVWQSTGAGNQ